MCGRFNLFERLQDLGELEFMEVEFRLDDWKPSYNIAPSASCPVFYNQEGIKADLLHWGLIPSWSEERKITYNTFNAKSETAHEKPSYRRAYHSQRALVPLNGWYEWHGPKTNRQPYYHHSTDKPIIMAAGLHEKWTDKITGEGEQDQEQEHVHSFTILTRDSYSNIAEIHHRMPVLLAQESWQDWLNPTIRDTDKVKGIINDQPKFDISIHPVSKQMSNARYQGQDCMQPICL